MDREGLLALLREATPSQREAVTSEKPFIVVSAGAGTGKTSTLAWRFAWLVATGEVKCSQILTLTYTEKAALEMASRIRATLRSWKESLRKVEEKENNLFILRIEEAEGRIEESVISTVHSFSMDLIRSAGPTRGMEAYRVPSMPEEEEFWRSAEEALDALDSEWFAARLKGAQMEWARILKEPDFLDVAEEFGTASLVRFARGAIDLFSSHGSRPEDLWLNEAALAQRDEALVNDLEPQLAEGDRELDRRFRLTLAKAAALLWAVWEAQKEKERWLSFDDMIRYAKEVIEEDPSLVKRFKAVLVDEFQDINGVQGAFLESLKKLSGASLFLVGDIKQSIYRFRHADPSIFARQIAEARAWDERALHVTMNESFRTRDALLETINDLFGFIWRDGIDGRLSIPYEPIEGAHMSPWWSERCSAACTPSFTILIERGGEEAKMEEEREAAARKLGDALSSLRGKSIWDKEKREARPCEWKDMAILVPTRTSFPALERVLRDEMRLPITFFSGMRYFSRFEARDASSFLKALADPSDDLALAGYLFSFLSGLPLHRAIDLASEKARGKEGGLWELLERRKPEIASRLLSLRKRSCLEGPSKALAALIDEARVFYALPLHLRIGAMLALQRAVDIAHEYEATLGPSLEGCATYLQEATREGLKAEEVNVDLEAENAIKVLTVHAAKGLEFPVVAVFGLEKHFTAPQGESLFPSIPLLASGSRFPDRWGQKDDPISKKIHRLIEEKEGSEEWKRLFYVACTRAQDALLLCGIWPKREGGPKEGTWLYHVFEWLNSKGVKLEDFAPPEDTAIRYKKPEKKATSPVRSGALALPRQGGGALKTLSATAFSTLRYCPKAFRLKYRQGLPLVWELPSEESASGGPELGSLAHWILARWNFAPDSIDRFLSRKGDYFESLPPALKVPLGEETSRRQLREWLLKFAEGKLGQVLRQKLKRSLLKREVPFRTRLSETVLVGIVDLLWEEEDRIHIWDYKITSLESAPMELYTEQMRFYGLAWHLLHPGKAVKLGLYFLRENKSELIEDVDFKETEEAVRESAWAGAKGPFSPAHARCDSCPWRNFCFQEAVAAKGGA